MSKTRTCKQITPLKIIMETKNHAIEEENHRRNLHFGVPAVIFQGVLI